MDIKLKLSKVSSFCSLEEYESLESFLSDFFSIGRSGIKKKWPEGKKVLKKSIKKKSEITLPFNLINKNHIFPIYEGPEIKTLYEDDIFIVFDKPHNIHGHPLLYNESNNILSYMRSIGKGNYLQVNKKMHERGLLYRLDFVTSGVLIYIKEDAAYEQLRTNFKNIVIKKKYFAVVKGHFSLDGEVESFFSPTGEKGYKMSVSDSAGDFKGKISCQLIKYKKENDCSLIEVSLFQGLRHQIRSQLAFLGFPILGDKLYGGEESFRVFLHAGEYQLNFRNNNLNFKSELPEFFRVLF